MNAFDEWLANDCGAEDDGYVGIHRNEMRNRFRVVHRRKNGGLSVVFGGRDFAAEAMLQLVGIALILERMMDLARRHQCSGFENNVIDGKPFIEFAHEVRVMQRLRTEHDDLHTPPTRPYPLIFAHLRQPTDGAYDPGPRPLLPEPGRRTA